jgi:Uma2 family endonuclease
MNGDSAVSSKAMKLTVKHGATLADLESTPAGTNAQLIDGVLYVASRPSNMHAVAITALALELGPFHRDRKTGWVLLFEPEVQFGKHVVIGDLVGWRRERMPMVPDTKRFELPPDFVCEGLSPSTARIDRGRKRELYAKAKVGHLWFVDPIHQTLEVLALEKRGYHVVAMAGGSDRGRFPPFDSIDLDLAALWQR